MQRIPAITYIPLTWSLPTFTCAVAPVPEAVVAAFKTPGGSNVIGLTYAVSLLITEKKKHQN